MYEQGYGREEVVNLFRFIDWLMQLPEELEEGCWREIQAYEEVRQMPYITSVERIGIRKGIEQGRQEGIQEGEALALRRQLTRRFGPLPPWAEERLAQADRESLERWAERLLEAAHARRGLQRKVLSFKFQVLGKKPSFGVHTVPLLA